MKQLFFRARILFGFFLVAAVIVAIIYLADLFFATEAPLSSQRHYQSRQLLDTSGFSPAITMMKPWAPNASLQEISAAWSNIGYRHIQDIDRELASQTLSEEMLVNYLAAKAMLYCYEGEPAKAYQILEEARAKANANDALAEKYLYTIIFFQGVVALRRGEDENCIMCRGESSCILPIVPVAVHTNPAGSRLAIKHFREYLKQFPDDPGVRWLLNLAYMTLGEYPHKVDAKFLVSFDSFSKSEFDLGKFRDIGHLAGVNRFNQAGGGIMEDFDNDGRLDIIVTSFDPTMSMAFYRNKGDGTFEDCSKAAGLSEQLGGMYCVQTDYNNDGHMDVFIVRGAWLPHPMRPSLLRNNGDGTFTDVTQQAGLLDPVNSITASWADYDNDGWLDLFICCDNQRNRLYHNQQDGTFKEVAAKAGIKTNSRDCKGAAWLDFDNDDFPDLFVSYYSSEDQSQLFHNNGDGTFTEIGKSMGIDGPQLAFSCWAWDFDNDGWMDIFATSYGRTLGEVVKGLQGLPHRLYSNKLFRNLQGKGFEDVTGKAGLDMVFATMGSNYGDFDNDGFLDMYLGTGEPDLSTLVPNRMFKNVAGKRFAEISGSTHTGHLQKGHSVACGDWDRDGDVDIFIEMGGVVNGDKYHNVLFQNPGQNNNWLTLKLIGKKTNRAAIGARIKVVTAGPKPLTVHRHVSSGSSFGANPLEQTIGLGKARQIASLEIHWPTSGTTQVFRNIAINQALEITEFASNYRSLHHQRIDPPK